MGLLSASALLGACGFKLRGDERFAFGVIHITPQPMGSLAIELRRSFDRVLAPPKPGTPPISVTLDLIEDRRDKIVVGRGAAGQVREYQLRAKVIFRLRAEQGRELIAPTEILQYRDISFNESAVLAKEAEDVLLYRDMQRDIVRQILRRVAAIQSL